MSITLTPDSPPATDVAQLRDPTSPRRPTDQEEFDAAVERNTRFLLPVVGGLAILAALVMATIALVISVGKNATTATMMGPAVATAPAATSAAPIYVSVAGSNKMGPDGKMHDSFSATDFAVKVGRPTTLRINNTDSGPHSITSIAAGVNITVLPGLHTYTIVAKAAGRFEWICIIPCDGDAHGWAMTHPGYMAGYITAT
jgi:plastocyanin